MLKARKREVAIDFSEIIPDTVDQYVGLDTEVDIGGKKVPELGGGNGKTGPYRPVF